MEPPSAGATKAVLNIYLRVRKVVFRIRKKKPLICVFFILILLVAFVFLRFRTSQHKEPLRDTMFPILSDFYASSIWTGASCNFSFSWSDNIAMSKAIFGCNITGAFQNESIWYMFSGNPTWYNVTKTLPSYNCIVAFQEWANDTSNNFATSGIRYMKVYTYNSTYDYFNCLGDAITTVENSNSWGSVDPYTQICLDQNSIGALESTIDNYAMPAVPNALVYCNNNYPTSWVSASRVYDNDSTTATNYNWTGPGNSAHLTLNLTTTAKGNTIQYLVQRSSASISNMIVDVANQTGSWVTVFDGVPTWNAYTNTSIFLTDVTQYTAMRFSFTLSSENSATAYVNETQAVNATSYGQCDYVSTLYYFAVINKLNLTWANMNSDINYALGNATMVMNLPFTGNGMNGPAFSPQNKWALYAFYFANSSSVGWSSYSGYNASKFNITAAYQQFDNAVNFSVNTGYTNKGLPMYIYDNTGETFDDRFYDEDACTIDSYLLFYSLLNQTDALQKAQYWWSYLNTNHWNQQYSYYDYSNDPVYASYQYRFEAEAPFFLKIISILKYYNSNVANFTRVLSDYGTRFISSEWNSCQWLSCETNATTYVVTHLFTGNYSSGTYGQKRLENTLGAWQTLEGLYLQLNGTYQNKLIDMLYGNDNTEPAWTLLLRPETGPLYNRSSGMFSYYWQTYVNASGDNPDATASAEMLMLMMGIVPGTSTMAFPLEELGYEYVDDFDPVIFQLQLNSTMRTINIPVVTAGTITFQYGVSPITCNFGRTGVYTIGFSPSWNIITSVTLKASLPNNMIYFYLPSTPIPSAGMSKRLTFQLCEAIGQYYQKLAVRAHVFDGADLTVSVDPMRVVRVPGTINGQTDIVCSFIGYLGDLERLAIPGILEKSKTFLGYHETLEDLRLAS